MKVYNSWPTKVTNVTCHVSEIRVVFAEGRSICPSMPVRIFCPRNLILHLMIVSLKTPNKLDDWFYFIYEKIFNSFYLTFDLPACRSKFPATLPCSSLSYCNRRLRNDFELCLTRCQEGFVGPHCIEKSLQFCFNKKDIFLENSIWKSIIESMLEISSVVFRMNYLKHIIL